MGTLRAKVAGVWQDIPIGPGPGVVAAGRIKATVSTVVPAGWLAFGQTVAGAQTLHPDLWAVAPAAWKAGADLVLPDATDCAMLGGGTLGAVGGLNTLTLAAANMPVHAHTLAHTHPTNHDHEYFYVTATTSAANPASHSHTMTLDNVAGNEEHLTRGVAHQWGGTPNVSSGNHQHAAFNVAINIPAYTGTSGASSVASTASNGSATPLDTTPKALRVNWIIKT